MSFCMWCLLSFIFFQTSREEDYVDVEGDDEVSMDVDDSYIVSIPFIISNSILLTAALLKLKVFHPIPLACLARELLSVQGRLINNKQYNF